MIDISTFRGSPLSIDAMDWAAVAEMFRARDEIVEMALKLKFDPKLSLHLDELEMRMQYMLNTVTYGGVAA